MRALNTSSAWNTPLPMNLFRLQAAGDRVNAELWRFKGRAHEQWSWRLPMKRITRLVAVAGFLSVAFGARAQFSMNALGTFGTGGWLAPGAGYPYMTTGNTERGLAFGTDHLYLVSRAGGNNIRILDPLTGADLGALNNTGISGGTFAVDMVSAGGDGAIYVGNLTTAASASSPFTVYRWVSESSAPVVAYSGVPLAGGRVGDSLAAVGSGSSTRLAAGFNSSPTVAGNNGYALVNPTAGTASAVGFAGTPPGAGDFRLGITFTDASHVLGSQGNGLARYTSYSGVTGTLVASPTLTTPAERPMSYAVVGGTPLLATISTGDATVRVYDMADPSNPVLIGSKSTTSGTLSANSNGTGDVAWGAIVGNTANLYALSSNQGIEAFVVVVPEPGTLALLAVGLALFAGARRAKT